MIDNEKKVMIFIVEGPSDESALGSIIREHFSSLEISFHVLHGDITTKAGVDHTTIVKEIHNQIKRIQDKYRYKDRDIMKIIHLVDTDGVFIEDSHIIEKAGRPTLYFTDHIETPDVEALCKRNETKSDLLYKLSSLGKIRKIPYSIYYMSCNLEHVLYNELREFSDEEKWECSDQFAERFEGRSGEFVSYLSNKEIAVPGTYTETWKFIQQDGNSLQRHTNLQQLFIE